MWSSAAPHKTRRTFVDGRVEQYRSTPTGEASEKSALFSIVVARFALPHGQSARPGRPAHHRPTVLLPATYQPTKLQRKAPAPRRTKKGVGCGRLRPHPTPLMKGRKRRKGEVGGRWTPPSRPAGDAHRLQARRNACAGHPAVGSTGFLFSYVFSYEIRLWCRFRWGRGKYHAPTNRYFFEPTAVTTRCRTTKARIIRPTTMVVHSAGTPKSEVSGSMMERTRAPRAEPRT